MKTRWLACALLVASCHPGANANAKPDPTPRSLPKKKQEKKSMSDGCTKTVGPAEKDKLGDVIEGLPDGAVLCLEPGTYVLSTVLQKSITLRGLGTPAEVILDGDGGGSVLRIAPDAKRVLLERLTVQNGAAVIGSGGIDGGSDDLTLREVVLRGHRAGGETPGAALGLSRGKATLERCRIEGNQGRSGGAIYLSGSAKVTLRDTLVTGNTATRSVIWVHQWAELHLERSTVAGNDADAAIELLATTVQTPTVTIADSIVAAAKTALANGPRLPGKLTVSRSLVEGEQRGATDGGGNKAGAADLDPATFAPRAGSPAIGLAAGGAAAGAVKPAKPSN